jgi:hypothetical protein
MRLSIRTDGLFQPGQYDRWARDRRAELKRAASAGFREELPKLRERLRGQMAQAFQLKRPRFAQVMTYKLYDSKPGRLPSAQVGALRAPWLEIHETGGTVRGKGRGLLIPLNQPKRIGKKAFKKLVDGLIGQGNAFFKRVDGKVILFAENLSESRAFTGRFARGLRKAQGVKKLKRGTEIPIAVLVPEVRLRKRLRVQETVAASVPRIAQSIQRNMRLT